MDKHGNGAIFDTRTALVIASPPPVDDREGQYSLRYDRHPTAAANELLARYVVSDIAGLNTSPAHRRASTQP